MDEEQVSRLLGEEGVEAGTCEFVGGRSTSRDYRNSGITVCFGTCWGEAPVPRVRKVLSLSMLRTVQIVAWTWLDDWPELLPERYCEFVGKILFRWAGANM
jgi:hypothetical protein